MRWIKNQKGYKKLIKLLKTLVKRIAMILVITLKRCKKKWNKLTKYLLLNQEKKKQMRWIQNQKDYKKKIKLQKMLAKKVIINLASTVKK